MKKQIALSALLLSISSLTSVSVAANDFSSATIMWSGKSRVIPGSVIVITGENGAIKPKDGVLDVNANGTFSTAEPINLESHGYDSATATIEGLYAAGWTLSKSEPIKITWGKNPTAGMNVKVKDIKSGKQLRTNVDVAGSEVSLSVENTAKVITTPVNPQAKLSVQATVLATVIV